MRSLGSTENSCSAAPKSGDGWKGPRPSVSTSTRRLIASGRSIAKRAAIAPPSAYPTTTGGDSHVRAISPSEPGEHAVRAAIAVGRFGRAVTGQVRRDHVMALHELREHAHPVRRVRGRAVKQHHRRAGAPVEQRRFNPGELQAVLADRQPRDQLPTGLGTGHLRAHPCLLVDTFDTRPMCRLGRASASGKPPNLAAGRDG